MKVWVRNQGGAAILVDTGLFALLTQIRELLTGPRTYYVRTDGSDANSGLVDSAGGAFLTIQRALDVVASLIDFGGFTVTIQVRDATYTSGGLIKPWAGGGLLNITGNTGTPANCLINVTNGNCFTSSGGVLPGMVTIDGFKLQTNTAGDGILISAPGAIRVGGNMNFGAIVNRGMAAASFGQILAQNGYTISGGGSIHVAAIDLGFVNITAGTVTLIGTPNFSTAFAQADTGKITSGFTTYTGAATGSRYSVSLNGAINTFGGGANYFPGNAAGATATGGQYA